MRHKAAEAEALGRSVVGGADDVVGRSPDRPTALAKREPTRYSQTWAMLIKRVYEIDPLKCARCGGEMKVVAFIEPPQGALIERYCVTAGYTPLFR